VARTRIRCVGLYLPDAQVQGIVVITCEQACTLGHSHYARCKRCWLGCSRDVRTYVHVRAVPVLLPLEAAARAELVHALLQLRVEACPATVTPPRSECEAWGAVMTTRGHGMRVRMWKTK
jgi:hypothetical protein